MLSLYGFEFRRANPEPQLSSFVPQNFEDGAITVVTGAGYNAIFDVDGTVRSEAELITKYRDMGLHPEIDQAVDEIINETMSVEDEDIVRVITDDLEVPGTVKKAIEFCFKEVLDLLDFGKYAYEIYRHWYIDGRLYFHCVIDDKNPTEGIQELRYIDPRKIRLVREITMQKSPGTTQSDAVIQKIVNEYYIFNDRGFTSSKTFAGSTTGLKISKDSVVNVNSGLVDANGKMVLSYLQKCLPESAKIRTPRGWSYLKDINVGDVVYAYDIEKNSFEETRIIDKFYGGKKPLIKIRTRHTSLECSPEHKILIKNKKTNVIEYVEAQDIKSPLHQIRLCFTEEPLEEWESVSEIIHTKKTEDVYDLTVEHPSHNFVVDSMVASNSIKALNQLRTLEDAHIIYTLSRSPQRRIWFIDVGNAPPAKAQQYVRDIMVTHRNRLNYDATTGTIRSDRRFLTMLDDYWIPRKSGSSGTDVKTLESAPPLTQMDNVLYFQKVLYNSLNVPVSRLNSDALFSIGRATEITRDELKFSKFIARLRMRFGMLFTKLIERQVVLKGIMSIDDWQKIEKRIKYDFAHDNYFMELKQDEILHNRVQNFLALQPLLDVTYSMEWARKNVLKQSNDDIEEQDGQIQKEVNDPTTMKLRMNISGGLPPQEEEEEEGEAESPQPASPAAPKPKPKPTGGVPPKPSPNK